MNYLMPRWLLRPFRKTRCRIFLPSGSLDTKLESPHRVAGLDVKEIERYYLSLHPRLNA
jgi:hypothetical protein